MVGIISNTAALFAQSNLNAASTDSTASIARLSSGNAIIKASDDVSGLAIGTVLAGTVTTLKAVLNSTNQAGSMLSIADGGLQNVADILQRQKSLATQANSGSLSNNERAFLDQEFQALVSEMDRIVGNTEFNGVKLLNGSISDNSTLTYSNPTAASDFDVIGTQGTTYATSATITVTSAADDQLIGDLSSATVQGTYTDTNDADFFLTINGQTYVEEAADISGSATALAFVNADTGATITITLADQTGVAESQANIDTIAAGIEADLATVSIYQDRAVDATSTGLAATSFSNTILEGTSSTDFELTSKSFDTSADTGPAISSFSVTAETATTDGQITVSIGGETYQTAAGDFNSNSGNIKAIGVVTLTNQTDSNEKFTIDFSNLIGTSVGVDTAANATALESALNDVFGVGSTGGVSFQVGNSASDTISLSLTTVASTSIYKDDDGTVQTLAIGTAAGAVTAADVLDNAINTVTSRRATVGALQSRFDFAANVVQTSIQNIDQARGNFLDADIAAESTDFATAQVRLQASISVLAQANSQQQNLLKLLG